MTRLSLLVLGLSGCSGSKVNKANADKVNVGMSESEVTSILGSPNESQEISANMPGLGGGDPFGGAPGGGGGQMKVRQCVWKSGDKAIVIQFMNGKVVQKVTKGL